MGEKGRNFSCSFYKMGSWENDRKTVFKLHAFTWRGTLTSGIYSSDGKIKVTPV